MTVRRLAPGLPIVARARDNEHALSLIKLGATRVVPEVLEAGLQLGHLLLEEVGMPVSVARDLVEALRAESELALNSKAESA
jgi:CPA2 family monovalent cation:H+ antiporter-2